MGAVKELLKKILPPPVRTFLREIEGLQRLTERQAHLLSEGQDRTIKAVERQAEELARLLGEQTERAESLRRVGDALTEQVKNLHRANEGLTDRLERLEKSQRETLEKLESLSDIPVAADVVENDLRTLTQVCETRYTQLQSAINRVENAIPNKTIYWSSAFERKVVEANWGDVTERPDFAEKFIRLTAGMDEESIRSIIRILTRQKKYLHSEEQSIDLFTRAEQEELRLLKENFTSEIIKLSDHLYAYRNYLLPINHFESSVFYFKHGLHQVKTLDRVKDKAVVDVGGFIGDSVLILSELSPKKIYTFEAVPDNFTLLQETVRLNHIEHVIAEQMALGSESGTLTVHLNGSGSTTIERLGVNYKGNVEVPVITLDDYVAEHQIEVGLIKVDIEGGEPAFLAGAKQTICTQKPILLLSIYHNAHDFFELKPMIESWGLGYRFSIHKPTFGNATSETLLIAEVE